MEKNDNDELKNKSGQESEGEALHVHNPFTGKEDKKITQEDLENEQKFKEALTERD